MSKNMIQWAVGVLVLISHTITAQFLEITEIELQGINLIIHYNLEDNRPDHEYSISLFSSKDNFTTPLARVTGDVGAEVKPGLNKKINWDITREFGNYKGNLTFEIHARIFMPFVKLTDNTKGKVYKRGTNYRIQWTSGNLAGHVNIELYNSKQERVWGENNLPNNGRYDFHIAGATKPGTDYKLKFTNTKDRNDFIHSETFSIKPKVPLLVKVGGLALLAGGGVVIATLGGSSNTPAEEPLIEWPGPPNNP